MQFLTFCAFQRDLPKLLNRFLDPPDPSTLPPCGLDSLNVNENIELH